MRIIFKDTTMKERARLVYDGIVFTVMETDIENIVYPIRDIEVETDMDINNIINIMGTNRTVEYDMRGGAIVYRTDLMSDVVENEELI